MSRPSDTGESVAATNRRASEAGWKTVLPLMQGGAKLARDPRTRRWYVDGHGSLTDAHVARLEREGCIRLVGAQAYQLVGLPA
jgi:hypothetical protein